MNEEDFLAEELGLTGFKAFRYVRDLSLSQLNRAVYRLH
jgi:hypothetical protein